MEWIDSGDFYCEVCAPHVEGSPYEDGAAPRPEFHPLCNCEVKTIADGAMADVVALIARRATARASRGRGTYQADDELMQRAQFSGEGVFGEGVFEVALISEGVSIGQGWEFGRAALAASVFLWDRAECFIDHARLGAGRSVRDLAGVFHSPRFDEATGAVVASLRSGGPSGPLLVALGKEMLSEGDAKPRVGFSADVGFVADGKKVRQIQKVFSVDLVYNPARGGAFVRALNSVGWPGVTAPVALAPGSPVADATVLFAGTMDAAYSREEIPMGTVETPVKAAAAGADGGASADLAAVRVLLDVQREQAALAVQAEEGRKVRAAMCGYLLDSGLAASKLPTAMQEHVRVQFADRVFEPTELTAAIDGARRLVSSLTGAGSVAGVGQIRGMYSSEDQLQAAVDDLLGAPRATQHANLSVHKLRGIRDMYHMLTGDYDYHGGFYADRVQLATTSDFTGLVKNALNKMVVDSWTQLGRAGYDWWERVTVQEHFDTLNQITGTLVGTVGTLPVVAEGGEYTELVVGDSPETASFVKYGGYIPLTLELIDRDDTRKLRAYPRELANAGLRRISGLVAAVFTDNSAVGPTMADTGALFNATAVTTAGGHLNLLTTALAAAEWEVVSRAVYNQPMLIKNATGYYGTGAKQAINPKFCLVPRALELTAKQILYPMLERASNIYSQNLQRGEPGDVVTVPEWTDATDWAAVCDPRVSPAIYVGERFGLRPEIFIAGDEQSPAVFANDEHRMKVRHFCAVWVNDFRPLHKSNV